MKFRNIYVQHNRKRVSMCGPWPFITSYYTDLLISVLVYITYINNHTYYSNRLMQT